ncbi:hypothetical protein PNQ69_20720 [Xanthomonas sp. A2111]|uniref:Uncharacterized protein n=1 Tax=Xanthomonas hawaiiensis TaxID=3003247 RepID=A0ABU2IAL2_9XANT|nr:hypothetical protein [Xanthomonas sp. A2111]MDS9995189.1 hypothetical protein [Xanthomonas sp. A2111]
MDLNKIVGDWQAKGGVSSMADFKKLCVQFDEVVEYLILVEEIVHEK